LLLSLQALSWQERAQNFCCGKYALRERDLAFDLVDHVPRQRDRFGRGHRATSRCSLCAGSPRSIGSAFARRLIRLRSTRAA
jgi:hypothetical protein